MFSIFQERMFGCSFVLVHLSAVISLLNCSLQKPAEFYVTLRCLWVHNDTRKCTCLRVHKNTRKCTCFFSFLFHPLPHHQTRGKGIFKQRYCCENKTDLSESNRFGFCVQWHINIRGLFNAKAILVEEQQ